MAEAAAKVNSIFVYPIKSCRGISVSEAALSSTGFRWDRQWAVVNSKGRACTQRVDPKLALVQVELPHDAFAFGWNPDNNSCLVIRAPGMDELKVSMCRPSQICDGVSVWEWSGSALDEGDEASKWFTNFLGKPSRLVRFNEESETRPVDLNYAPGFRVMFCDGYPFLLVSKGSLDSLNQRLEEPVLMNRFRPKKQMLACLPGPFGVYKNYTFTHLLNLPDPSIFSILVDCCEPFAEDLWKEIKIENLTFRGVKLCARCKVITINQENAISTFEPTETLEKFRSGRALCPGQKGQQMVYFGQKMVCHDLHEGNAKMIKVGDPVFVIKAFSSYDETST